jgi:hypothetical protein
VALLRNSRKTECGATRFLAGLVVRAARFTLVGSKTKEPLRQRSRAAAYCVQRA